MDTDALAERLAPMLATLVHPGDADTPPFPLSLPTFQTAALPEGMTEEMAEELGLPTPDLGKHFLEALFALIESQGITLIETTILEDMAAAASVNEGKRNEVKEFLADCCGTVLMRVMVKDFDTKHPRITPDVIPAMAAKSMDCSKGHRS